MIKSINCILHACIYFSWCYIFVFQCVWPLATHTVDQIYGINEANTNKDVNTKDKNEECIAGNKETESKSPHNEVEKDSIGTDNCTQIQSNYTPLAPPLSNTIHPAPKASSTGAHVEEEINDSNEIRMAEKIPVENDESKMDDGEVEAEFLRPLGSVSDRVVGNISRTQMPNAVSVYDDNKDRITPPPSLISPIPSTPAGSLTPVCSI